jgi:mono/diheme cytochrome c family protein
MKTFLVLVAIVIFLMLAAAAYVWWGGYNVAADVPHRKITLWFLEAVRERSISVHSEGVSVSSLNDPKLAESGLPHYHAVCRLCHGAPDYPASEFAEGLNPDAPHLTSKDVRELNDKELYWVVKNGIKMTGMPAFGSTHSDEEILAIVAFVRRLPELKPNEYRSMIKAAGLSEEEIPHHHKEGRKSLP